MTPHQKTRLLRHDLDQQQCEAVVVSLEGKGIAPDAMFHNVLGEEAERLFPLGPTVVFKSKRPHDTRWLELSYPEKKRPTHLLRAMAKVGWQWDPGMRKVEKYDPLLPVPLAPAYGGRVTVDIAIRGGGIFGSWTKEEEKRYMRQIRKVLRQYGFVRVGHHKLTLEDML